MSKLQNFFPGMVVSFLVPTKQAKLYKMPNDSEQQKQQAQS